MAKKIDKQALRMKIQELDIDNELKSQLLEAVSEKKTFGLVWEDHPEDAEERLKSALPVLKEDKSAAIISDADDAPDHVLIEGDNLYALTALTYTHEGKIDVIYIDPPYNTGKEFIYNDKLVDKDDAFKHSKWMSCMYKRLSIARKLLSDTGVILISIDNHEFSTLKCMCDEIFNESNLFTNFIWKTDGHTDNQDDITDVHEYILCYAYNKSTVCINSVVDPNVELESKILRDYAENSITKNGPKNPPSLITLPIGFPCEVESLSFAATPNFDDFKIEVDAQKYISRDLTSKYSVTYPAKVDLMEVEDYKLKRECRVFSGWTSASKLKSFIANGCKPIDDEGTSLRYYLSKNGVIYYRREGRTSHYVQTVLENFGTTETNKYMLERMSVTFDYPKPIELITYLLSIFAKKDSIILDFYAGSGTTLHSTMLLNRDGGKRQSINVQTNFNNICRMNYSRNSQVITNGHSLPSGEKVPPLDNNNLRYYRTDFVSRQSSHQNKKEQAYAMLDLLCIKENVYDEKKMFGSLSLEGKEKLVRYFADDETKMLLIYDTRVVPYIVREIAAMTEENLNIKTYIFADGSYPYTADFEEVLSKVTLVAMPFSMNKALRNVLPAENDIELNDEPDTEEE